MTTMKFKANLEHNHTKDDDSIFVFGSNLLGIHGGGAAWYASHMLGAQRGVASGLTGKTYAIPTCSKPGVPLSLEQIKWWVEEFKVFARSNPEMKFFVSEIGCGIAGFFRDEIAPMFADAPSNCLLPPEFIRINSGCTDSDCEHCNVECDDCHKPAKFHCSCIDRIERIGLGHSL